MIVDDIYKTGLTNPTRIGAIVHPVEGEIEDYWKRNFDYIKEECHSNDNVSAISNLVLEQINSMISSGKGIRKDYIPGGPEIIFGCFPFSAFDDTIYINFEVFNFDNAQQFRYFADVLGGKTEETPIRIYFRLPYINGEIDERYKNVIEHELMHAYWIHAKGGFMMSEKDYKRYKEIINSSENFNSDDEQFTMFVKALFRCLYISFGSEKSAIVQSFDKVVRARLNNGETNGRIFRIKRKYGIRKLFRIIGICFG